MGFVGNFMNMMFAVLRNYKLADRRQSSVDAILHADHEQNASTSTVRLAGSSVPIRTLVAAVSPRWGTGTAVPTRRLFTAERVGDAKINKYGPRQRQR